jgi:hypothetical protein
LIAPAYLALLANFVESELLTAAPRRLRYFIEVVVTTSIATKWWLVNVPRESPAPMERLQKDAEVPVDGASEESEDASVLEELELVRQLGVTVYDGSETPVHGPRDLLGLDIDSGDQVVPETLGDQGEQLEEVDLVCDEKIDFDSEFPAEDSLADQQVTNLQKNDEEKSTDERSARRGETGLEEVTSDERAETSTQVAEDPAVSNSQNEAPGQGGAEDHVVVLYGDIINQAIKDAILEIMREKSHKDIPPK